MSRAVAPWPAADARRDLCASSPRAPGRSTATSSPAVSSSRAPIVRISRELLIEYLEVSERCAARGCAPCRRLAADYRRLLEALELEILNNSTCRQSG